MSNRTKTPPRLNRDGLPIDPRCWTRRDWMDLYRAMRRVVRGVSRRHAKGVK